MVQGYDSSTFTHLEEEYHDPTCSEFNSMPLNVSLLQGQRLRAPDIVDQGFDSNCKEGEWYWLEDKLFQLVAVTVLDLQDTLNRAMMLLEEQESVFVVDPDRMLLPILQGHDNLALFNTVWIVIMKRISMANCFFIKYKLQFQEHSIPNSPASTKPKNWDTVRSNELTDTKLQTMFALVLCHLAQSDLENPLMEKQ